MDRKRTGIHGVIACPSIGSSRNMERLPGFADARKKFRTPRVDRAALSAIYRSVSTHPDRVLIADAVIIR
ncbi:hypothetical protein GCM10010833_24400 [Blastomonas aquatica]|uniref:Uncharacterized protein n=1 Tax=Blastomonas aquatica TaxID=1510276 RepID=A0ABQ1JGD6_9SPHN|nr:hypothetical protein GCM10010833_24400 [Blastomonas aquatica]